MKKKGMLKMEFYLEKLSPEDEAEFLSFYNEFMEAGFIPVLRYWITLP